MSENMNQNNVGGNNGHGAIDTAAGRHRGAEARPGQMLKGGVIMDVVTPEHAKIAEEAGACSVMALERVPADIRKQGGVARMSDPGLIVNIMETVTIPVMAKCRSGTSWKPASWKPSASTTSTRAKC